MVMEEQKSVGIEEPIVLHRKRSSKGIDIAPFLCPRCGYVELYKKTKKGRGKL
jgi:predicted nucleic-acid-binding Zn-ribbon protein